MSVCSDADHAEVVGHRPQVREQLADHQARLAARAEPERRAHQRAVVRLIRPQPERRDRLAVISGQHRLVVERVHVREPAGQEDDQQVLGLRLVVGPRRREQAGAVLLGRPRPARVRARTRPTSPRRPMTSGTPAARSVIPSIMVVHPGMATSRCRGTRWRSAGPWPGSVQASRSAAQARGSLRAMKSQCAGRALAARAAGPRPARRPRAIRGAGRPRRPIMRSARPAAHAPRRTDYCRK